MSLRYICGFWAFSLLHYCGFVVLFGRLNGLTCAALDLSLQDKFLLFFLLLLLNYECFQIAKYYLFDWQAFAISCLLNVGSQGGANMKSRTSVQQQVKVSTYVPLQFIILAFWYSIVLLPVVKKTCKRLIAFNQRLLSLGASQWPSARQAPSVFLNIADMLPFQFLLHTPVDCACPTYNIKQLWRKVFFKNIKQGTIWGRGV